MKLYYAEVLNPRKACAAAKYLDAPVDYVRIDLGRNDHYTPAFSALNPNRRVPVLELDDGGSITESNAIMCYLAHQAGSALWPADDARKIEIVGWLSWNSEHFTRHGGELYFQHIIMPHFALGAPDPQVTEEATGSWRKSAAILNAHLSGRDWLVGNSLTVADFAVAAALPYADESQIPLRDFPEIERWHAQLNALPAWREPFPQTRAAA
jgi:glutathione S-transferase